MQLPKLSKVFKTEVEEILNCLNQRKAPGYDLITAKTLKELSKFITFLFNAVLRVQYFPEQWKVALVIVIQF